MTQETKPKAPRSLALDALRGLAIIGMVLSGSLPTITDPTKTALPRWMFHAQVGPPTYKYDANLSGITWVDLVFPFFIFALGAAIPFAMRSRLEKGWPQWEAALSLVKRWLLLCAFAIFQGQTGPWGYAVKTGESVLPFVWTLLAFISMFLALWRTPDTWKPALKWGISLSGWALGLAMFYTIPLAGGKSMSVEENNIILWILANLAMLTGFAWMLTRHTFFARYCIMALCVAVSIFKISFEWVHNIPIWFDFPALGWNRHDLGTLFSPGLIAYLGVALPGTIAGDLLQQWMRGQVKDAPVAWSPGRMWAIVVVGITMSIITCSATLSGHVTAGWLTCIAVGALGWWLVRNAQSAAEVTVRKFFLFGAVLLFLGYLVEPYGGVKKDPSTLSYFYMTAGLAFYMLSSLLLMIDVMGWKRPFAWVIGSGQNPMIAYVAGNFFWTPVLGFFGFGGMIARYITGAFSGTVWAVIHTAMVMGFATFCTRMKIFWRT